MKSPLSFSLRQSLLLVILVAVAGLLLARHFSHSVPVQPSPVSGSTATETPVHPATTSSSGSTSESVASETVAALDRSPSEKQGAQVAASSPSSQPDSTPVLTERAETKQQIEEPNKHSIEPDRGEQQGEKKEDRKSTRLNSSHSQISYAVFCLKKKKTDVER